jgi:hypothetical protein
MVALLNAVQSVTQMTYKSRSILSNSMNNNNKYVNFIQLLLLCVIPALPISIRFQVYKTTPYNQGYPK